MKLLFSYLRRNPSLVVSQEEVERCQFRSPRRGTGWQRRPGACLPNGDLPLSLHANHIVALIVACRDDRMVWRNSSQMPHVPIQLQNANNMLPVQATFSFLDKQGIPLSFYFSMWYGASSGSGTKWEVPQVPFGKLWGWRTPEPRPYPLVGRNLPSASFCMPRCLHRWFGCTFLISNEESNCPRVWAEFPPSDSFLISYI